MNRREFILKGLKLGGALALGGGLYTALSEIVNPGGSVCHAYDYTLFASGLPIVDSNLSFSSLSLRSATDAIIVHHTASTADLTAADVHRIHRQNGWSGIGYHLFIRKDGLIETGRPLEDVGAHTYGYNKDTIGVCLSGNFNVEYPSDAQLESATKLIGLLCQIYSLNPDAGTVYGHRDFNATACPGDNLYADLPNLREYSANYI